MLSTFPTFQPLHTRHAQDVKAIISHFQPYSDYNLISLYSWNTKNQVRISQLFGNVLVRFTDYETGESYISLLGKTKINTTLNILQAYFKKKHSPFILRNVPETTVRFASRKRFHILEDRDNFDYIYVLKMFVGLEGRLYKKKRNMLKNFMLHYGEFTHVKKLNIRSKATQKNLVDIFTSWRKERSLDPAFAKNEFLAFKKYLTFHTLGTTLTYGLFIHGELVGFSCVELLGKHTAICHFEKIAAGKKPGVGEYFLHEVFADLHKKGCKKINYQQDLGIPGLRNKKILLRPQSYLKKYTIEAAPQT